MNAPLIGRCADLSKLAEALDGEHRIVTLLGPAGVGKSRLVRAFAEANDAVVCDLSSARTVLDACRAVGRACQIALSSSSNAEEATATLVAALDGRVLVLDGFDRLVEVGGELVGALARRAPVLVTSRARLKLEHEAVIDLAPLAPLDARALFIERARLARAGYAPAGPELEAVDELCGALDRLPLAIELAAARLRVVGAVELVARLGAPLELLDSPDRSLRQAIEDSLRTLGDAERTGLIQCAAFSGGMTLEAAEQVLHAGRPAIDILGALRDRSLIWSEDTLVGARFGLYRSIRERAEEQLAKDDPVLLRHADYYLANGIAWAARAEGKNGAESRRRLELEQDNLLQVHARACTAGDAERALRAALALQPVLIARGPAALRLELLENALALVSPTADRRLTGWAYLARGDTRFGLGEMLGSRADLEAAREDGRATSDERLEGRSLWRLGSLDAAQARYSHAKRTLEEALALHRRVADRIHEGRCLASLGVLALDDGDLEQASELFEEALSLHEATGDDRWTARTVGHLGAIEDACGNLEEAGQLYLQAVRMHEALGHRRHLAAVLGALGALDTELGNLERARATLERALATSREVPNRRTEGVLRIQLGGWFERSGDIAEAQKNYRRAIRVHRDIQNPRLLAVALLHLARTEAVSKPDRARAHLEEARAASSELLLTAMASIVEGHLLASVDPRAASERLDGELPTSSLVRRAAQALRAALSDGLPPEALVVGSGWFRAPNGARVDLSSRRAPAALLSALAQARTRDPGARLTVEALFEAGWPSDRASQPAAASRVYVAISTLRKLGLEALLIRDEAGYRLDPAVPLLVA